MPMLICALAQFVATQDLVTGLRCEVVVMEQNAKMTPIMVSSPSGGGPSCCINDTCRNAASCKRRHPHCPIAVFVELKNGGVVINKAFIEFYSARTNKLLLSVGANGINPSDGSNVNNPSAGYLLKMDESAASKINGYCDDEHYVKVILTGKNIPEVVYLVDAKAGTPVKRAGTPIK